MTTGVPWTDDERTVVRSVGRSVGGSVGGRDRECVGRTKRRRGRGEKRQGGSAKFAVRRCAGRKRGIYYGSGLSGLLVVCRRLEARFAVRLVLGGSEGGDRSNDVAAVDVDVCSSVGVSRAPPRGAASASRGISFSFSLSSFVYILSVSLLFSISPFLALSDRRGGPAAEKTSRDDDVWKFNNRKKRSVLPREAQCPTGRAWTISRKVRTAGAKGARNRSFSLFLSLCVTVSPSLSYSVRYPLFLSLFLSSSVSRSLSRYTLAASCVKRTKRVRITPRTDIFFSSLFLFFLS